MNTQNLQKLMGLFYPPINSNPIHWGHALEQAVVACSDVKAISPAIKTFDTGCDVLHYEVSDRAETHPAPNLQATTAYIVLQGQVRILGHCRQRRLPYSATLLQPGDLLGADHLFCEAPLSYQAVAASSCQVVQVSYSYLKFWVDQCPTLGTYWQQHMQQRAQQLFFKRFTPLQTLPSTLLTTRLLPQIQELQVAAGATLREAVKPYEGYFWLRSGCLTTGSTPTRTLAIGNGWSSRDSELAAGVAQTPVRLFHLNQQPWETPDLSPLMQRLGSGR